MDSSKILITKQESICILTIDSPSNLNALDTTLIDELSRKFKEINQDDSILVVILTGSGKSFVAGADIAAMAQMTPCEGGAFGSKGAALMRKIETLSKPVIAAVNGYALGGGCELALACDIRVASEKARFGQPEVSLGITPGFSGTVRLPMAIGMARAKELIYTGRMVDANEALAIGLVNKVVEHDSLLEEAMKIALQIAKNSPTAVKYAKESIDLATNMSREEAIRIENNFFALCFANEDQKEGMRAFLEKRKPSFKPLNCK